MARRTTVFSSILALLVLLATLSGCVSTKERYQRVQTYQNEGKVVAAAFEMVQVLDDEPNWPNGRRELHALTKTAMTRLMDAARGNLQKGKPLDAVATLDRIDELQAACQSVAVSVNQPEGYAALRPRAQDASYTFLLDRAAAAEQNADWDRAVSAYEDARRFAPSDNALRTLDRRQAETHFSWAAAEMDQNHFRTAFDRAETAARFLGDDDPMRKDIRSLQDAAVAEGTRVTAFLPLWQTREADDTLPDGLLREINDVLVLEHWSAPPVFIASVPPVPLHRTLRRLDLDRTVLSRKQAARVGRQLESDFVVVGDLVEYHEERDNVETSAQTARWSINTRDQRGATSGRRSASPTDTTFFVERYERELYATVEVRLIDARAGRTLVTHTIDVDVRGPMERGVFDGNWRNLDLSGAETSLFREEDVRARERELELTLADAVASAVANETFTRIVQSIP